MSACLSYRTQAAKLIQPAKRPLDYPPPPNVVSNVPAVMLLRTLVVNFPDPHAGWLTLALASTLAGNLTITGSIANIIVVERAAAEGVQSDFASISELVCHSLW
jgi:hypothetical protein